MSFYQFLLTLKSRQKIVWGVLLITVLAVLAISLLLPKKYTATTALVLDVKTADPLNGTVAPALMMPSYMATQTDIIMSDRVAQKAAHLMKLDESVQVKEQWREATGGQGSMMVWLGQLLQKKLEVKPSRDSYVINIDFSAADPVFAAAVANAIAQAYIETNLELKVEPARQYAVWFEDKVKSSRAVLEKAQGRLAEFQRQTGYVATDERSGRIENAKIEQLSNQLALTESQTADTQSKQKQTGSKDTMTDVMQNPIIQNIKAELIKQEGKLQEMSHNLGYNHPQYQATKAEVEHLRKKLDSETQQIMKSIETSNNINRQKENELKAAIRAHKQQVITDSAQRDQAMVLQNDVESAQKAYDMVMQRYTSSHLESQSSQTNISVLNPATEPIVPASPKLLLNLIVSVFMGGFLGMGVAFASEMFDKRVRTVEDLLAQTGVPVLAHLQEATPAGWMRKMFMAVMPNRYVRAASGFV
ncbi:MAG TPA: chain length determinant protein EpsF [Gallionella sp.]|nr:chain length determinant protein EpsF [Gallionella sp.]